MGNDLVVRRGGGAMSWRVAVAGVLLLSTMLGGARAQQRVGSLVVVLVRHAEKGTTPAGDPGLTEAGRARAEALANALDDARVDAVITTPYQRARQTAEPIARARHLTPVVVRAGADTEAHARNVADAVRRQAPGSLVLVVGHSDTIPGIIRALGGPTLPNLCDLEYATLFTLVLPAEGVPRLIRSSYGTPDPPEPCGRKMAR